MRGESREIGIKQTLFNALATFAVFQSKQEKFGEWIGRDTTSGLNLYQGVNFESSGYEMTLAGEITEDININAGFTKVDVKDQYGDYTRRFIPAKQLKIATAYDVSALPGLRVGGGINWQSEIYYANTEVQGSYALVDLFAQYSLTPAIQLALNIHNATDKQHRLSPQWGQANYGAPRNYMASVSWQFCPLEY